LSHYSYRNQNAEVSAAKSLVKVLEDPSFKKKKDQLSACDRPKERNEQNKKMFG